MESKTEHSPLLHPLFWSTLLLLLLNDHYLKYACPGFITGKLSDVCGLFVFHVFLLWYFPGRAKTVTLFVILFFCWWKSPLSQTAIDFLNTRGFYTVHRTIDYTDLFTLPVLFISWYFFHKSFPEKIHFRFARLLKFFTVLVCLYSFFATTMIKTVYIHQKRNVKHTPAEIINTLSSMKYSIQIDSTTTAAKYTYYTLIIRNSEFNAKTDSSELFYSSLKLTLYPQSKRKTRIEAGISYPWSESWASGKDSVKKELKKWLKTFE